MSDGLPKIGELVAGRYRIQEELGRGGYGVVYRARQDVMGRDVALKVLKPEAAKKSTEVERFRREVFHASGLKHPNTIQLYDFGETNGLFYIVMEFLQGLNLREHVLAQGPFEHDGAVEITLQILKSLREAHEHGIVHRDLKPENIFLVNTGQDDEILAKVLDFGLSKYVEGAGGKKEPTLTKEGMIFGTPQYMSPEQAYGQKVTPMTDIYALGLLIYEMVTARCAFTGRSSMEILIKQVSQPIPSMPEKLQGTVLAEFVDICTQKESKDRFPNAGEAYTWLSRRKNSPSMIQMFQNIDPEAHIETPEMVPAVKPMNAESDTQARVMMVSQNFELRLASMPMVGRQEELDSLLYWSRQALYSGGVSWITGDIGVGKTRLLNEWVRHFEMDGVLVLRGEYKEHGGPLVGLREALAPLTEQQTGGGQDTLPQVLSMDRLIELRGILLVDDDQKNTLSEDAAFAVVEQAIFSIATNRPTVLVLENLQWADSFTQRLLEHWQEELAALTLPLLLVLTSRTDEVGTSQKLNHISGLGRRVVGPSFAHAIHLNRLTDAEALRMLGYLLPTSEAVEDRILRLSRGNPLFLTEVSRYLLEAELVEFNDAVQRWDLRSDLPPGEDFIPPSMSELVLRRIRSLVTHTSHGGVFKALILRAVLIGSRFELRVLKELLRRESRPDLEFYIDDAVDRFARAGILQPVVMGTKPGLEFSYSLSQKTLFDSGIDFGEDAKRVHAYLAEIKTDLYQSTSRDRRLELSSSIAEHYMECEERLQAHKWWMTASTDAEDALDFRASLNFLNSAQMLLSDESDPDGERLLEVRLRQGKFYQLLGEYGPAEYALSAALEEARRVGDQVGEAMASEALAQVYTLLGRYHEARSNLDSTIALYEKFPDFVGILRCETYHAEILRYQGRYVEAQQRFQEGINKADALNNVAIAVQNLYGLGQCYYAHGHLRSAVDVFHACRKRAEVAGLWRIVSSVDIELAMVAIMTEGVNRAEQLVKQALEAKRKTGDTLGQAHAHLILGMALRRSLRVQEAEYHAERALTLNERLSHKYGIGKSILLHAEIAWLKGKPETALTLIDEALQVHTEIADSHGRALSLIYKGLFCIDAEKPDDAAAAVDEAMRIGGEDGLGVYQPNGLLFLGMVYEAQENIEEAIAYYGESLELAEQMGNRESASLAAISLAKLHIVMGDIESASQEIPIARNQAERLGNNIALMLALTGEAWLARVQNNPHTLQPTLQKLRVLADQRGGANLRVPEKLAKLAMQLVTHQPANKVRQSVSTVIELIEAIGAEDLARKLQKKLALFL